MHETVFAWMGMCVCVRMCVEPLAIDLPRVCVSCVSLCCGKVKCMCFLFVHLCATYVCTTITYLYSPSWPNVYTECIVWGQRGVKVQNK